MSPKPIYLLLHGGSHGAWCWEPLIEELRARGHTALALDLPGHGDDRSPREFITRQSYVEAVGRFIAAHSLQNLIVVGHSLAGAVLPEIARANRSSIRGLVYLAGLVLNKGEAPIDLIPEERRAGYFEQARLSPDNSFKIADARAKEIFFSDIPDDIAQSYCSRITPQPFGVYLDAAVDNPIVPGIGARYLLSKLDKTLPRTLCTACASKLDVEVEEIDAGHDSMLSKPIRLAELLLREEK